MDFDYVRHNRKLTWGGSSFWAVVIVDLEKSRKTFDMNNPEGEIKYQKTATELHIR